MNSCLKNFLFRSRSWKSFGIAAEKSSLQKTPFSHPGLGDNGASIPLQVLDFDENSNQVANSPLGKEELTKTISGEESGYSSLG